MQKVKNYMNAYKSYAKTEREKFQAMKESNVYSQEYILDQEKKLNQALDNKRQEYLKEMNSIIDSKIAAVHKLDTSSIEYQTVVSN
jgi:NAD+--asparagine ADP-ribosyltransferase